MSFNKENIRNQQGAALTLVLILVAVFAVLGSSLLYTVNTNHQSVLHDEVELQAYYIAEIGVIDAIEEVKKNPDLNSYSVESDQFNNEGTELNYEVEFEKIDNQYFITSTGYSKKSVPLDREAVIYVAISDDGNGSGSSSNNHLTGFDFIDNDRDVEDYLDFTVYSAGSINNLRLDESVVLGDIYCKQNISLNYNNVNDIDSRYANHTIYIKNGSKVYVNGSREKSPSIPNINFDSISNISYGNDVYNRILSYITSDVEHSWSYYNNDLHISQNNISDLDGYIHINGDLIIDEGIEIDVNNLLVYAERGILIGNVTSSLADNTPVKINGTNVLFIAERNYNSNSNGNNGTSIIVNNCSLFDGWLFAGNSISFNEPSDNSIVKVSGGIIAGSITFPQAIQVGGDTDSGSSGLTITNWDVN